MSCQIVNPTFLSVQLLDFFPLMDVTLILSYAMLIPFVGGVGLACIKEGKGVDINIKALLLFAYMATNTAAELKGKLGSSVTKSLKADPSNLRSIRRHLL